MSKKIYTRQVFEDDDGELFFDLGEVADELGWKVGDTLVWKDNGDGSWSLSKFTGSTPG